MPVTSTDMKRSRSNTRARLLDAAYDVFAEKGFQAATVEDVCAAAGFSRGAFYSNFATQDELFLSLWDEQADRIIASVALLRDAIADAPTPVGAPFELLAGHELYDRQWFLLNTEFLLHAMRSPEAARQLSRHRERLRAGIGGVISAMLDASNLRPPPGIDVDTLTRLIIAGHEGCQNQTRIESPPGAPPVLFRTLLQLVLSTCEPAPTPDRDPR